MSLSGEQSMFAQPENKSGERGRPGLQSSVQRGRVLEAFAHVVAEQGYGAASVNQIISRAGVSRATFYESFDSREDCFVSAFDGAVERMGTLLSHAYSSEPTWRDGLRAALAGLLELLEADVALAQLLIVESLMGGPRVLARRTEVLEDLASVIDAGAAEGPEELPKPPRLTAETLVGGIFEVLHGRLLGEGSPLGLMELCGPLTSIAVLPYLGAQAAAEELTRPQAPRRPASAAIYDLERARVGAHERKERSKARSSAGPLPRLGELDMRLTYRTLRCLRFIGANAGACNREIAMGAGISDQGQISKLLTRITHLGLVEKAPTRAGRPNHWELTELGERVLRDIEDRTLRWEAPHRP
jgi:AcrR family transcriptional regulator/DNA-binding MarR family transcriptional regulator